MKDSQKRKTVSPAKTGSIRHMDEDACRETEMMSEMLFGSGSRSDASQPTADDEQIVPVRSEVTEGYVNLGQRLASSESRVWEAESETEQEKTPEQKPVNKKESAWREADMDMESLEDFPELATMRNFTSGGKTKTETVVAESVVTEEKRTEETVVRETRMPADQRRRESRENVAETPEKLTFGSAVLTSTIFGSGEENRILPLLKRHGMQVTTIGVSLFLIFAAILYIHLSGRNENKQAETKTPAAEKRFADTQDTPSVTPQDTPQNSDAENRYFAATREEPFRAMREEPIRRDSAMRADEMVMMNNGQQDAFPQFDNSRGMASVTPNVAVGSNYPYTYQATSAPAEEYPSFDMNAVQFDMQYGTSPAPEIPEWAGRQPSAMQMHSTTDELPVYDPSRGLPPVMANNVSPMMEENFSPYSGNQAYLAEQPSVPSPRILPRPPSSVQKPSAQNIGMNPPPAYTPLPEPQHDPMIAPVSPYYGGQGNPYAEEYPTFNANR